MVGGEGGIGGGVGFEKGRVTPATAPSYVMHFHYLIMGWWEGGGEGGIANLDRELETPAERGVIMAYLSISSFTNPPPPRS